MHLSYYGVNDASHGITIDQWRALLPTKILATVREYIASATPEQIRHDMAEADFDKLRGVGDGIQ